MNLHELPLSDIPATGDELFELLGRLDHGDLVIRNWWFDAEGRVVQLGMVNDEPVRPGWFERLRATLDR